MPQVTAASRLFSSVFLICIAFLSFPIAEAQILAVGDDTSTPIAGAGHDYIHMLDETVNPANGSVSLRIQTPTPKGRGITLPFSFAYDSNGVNHLTPGGIFAGPTSDISYASQGGWAYSIPLITETSWSSTSGGVTCNFSSGYTFQDPSGGRHALGLAAASFSSNGQYLCSNPITAGGDAKYAASLVDPSPYGNVNPPLQVTDSEGTVYYFANPEEFLVTSHSSGIPNYIEDRNGNKISISPGSKTGAFTITDTAGRTSISSNGIGSTGTTNTVSVSGLNYQVAWTSTSPNFSFPSKVAWIAPGYTCTALESGTTAETVVSTITLPNGKQYKFYYGTNNPNGYSNPYGLLSEIDYPSGGWVRYTWKMSDTYSEGIVYDAQPAGQGDNFQTGCQFEVKTPVIATRTVGFGPGSGAALTQTFTYGTTWNSDTGGGPSWSSKTTTVSTTDNIRGLTSQTTYTYGSGYGGGSNNPYLPDFMASQLPLEKTIQYYNWGNTTTPFRTVNKTWADIYDLASETTILDNGQESETTYLYTTGALPQLKTKNEYDYGLNAVGPLLQQTAWTYQSFATTPVGGIINDKPLSVITYDGSSNRVAETDYAYDSYTNGITSVSATDHDDTNFGTSFTARGNPTSKTQKCFIGSTTCTDSVTTYAYDETGQVLSVTDPCGNSTCADMPTGASHTTTYSYTDSYSSGTPPGNTNAYLTTITHPAVNGVTTHNYFQYSYSDGQLTSSQDDNDKNNGTKTAYIYNSKPTGCSNTDGLDRLTETDYPNGGQTTYCYNDAAYSASNNTPNVTTTRKIDSSNNLVTITAMDGGGHVVRMILNSDPDGITYTDTSYDGMEKVKSVSNPYRSINDSTYGITAYTYDSLGRQTTLTHPDSSILTTNYTGRATQVLDEGNGTKSVQRVSQSDGLGRLNFVCEVTSTPLTVGSYGTPLASCGQDNKQPGFLTSYGYDPLGNLLSVSQTGVGNRTFQYDSLSRLVSATNPEAEIPASPGSTTYTYDLNSNVYQRTRPAPNTTVPGKTLTTTYQYDSLNRLTAKKYSDTTTPWATYAYDQTTNWTATLANGIGRKTGEFTCPSGTSGPSCGTTAPSTTGTIFSYDPMGRVAFDEQCTPKTCGTTAFSFNYTYDLIGDQLTSTNGVGVTFTSNYSKAARLTSMSSSLSDANHPANLISSLVYSPFGMPVSDNLGNGINETFGYSNRGWIFTRNAYLNNVNLYTFNMQTCTSTCGNPLTYAPNGNVLAANDLVNGNWKYTYDDFNRLLSSSCTGSCPGGQPSLGFQYVYDAFGNRWQQNATAGSGPQPQYAFNTNNQIMGVTYDDGGNVVNDLTNKYSYDAENRLLTTYGGPSGDTGYVYDAEGRRIAKNLTGAYAQYLYDLSGHQVAVLSATEVWNRGEVYDANGRHLATYTGGTSGKTYFNFTDWLGTERSRMTAAGTVCETITSLPFGDAQATNGTCSDASPFHFTGKERDVESNLDNFGARYYASTMGRFMTPDWSEQSDPIPYADLGNPQSLNLYAYVKNNPAILTDPNGHCDVDGEHHGAIWCWLHKHDLFGVETQRERAADLRSQLSKIGIYKNGARVDWSKLSDKQVFETAQSYFTALLSGQVGTIGTINPSTGALILGTAQQVVDYINVTRPGSVNNIQTNVTPDEFGQALEENGYTKSVSADGNAVNYTKGDRTYSVYQNARSTGGPTAQVTIKGDIVAKIRLQ